MEGKKSILIAEDDAFINEIYTKILSDAGYQVVSSLDGADAIKKLSENNFSLVLLDIMMPKATGIEVLKSMRMGNSKNNKTPVFMITNLGQEDIMTESKTLGISGFIIKSQLTPRQIVAEVNKFFSQANN